MKLFGRAHPQNKNSFLLHPTSLYHRSPCSLPQKSSGLLPLRRELASKTDGFYVLNLTAGVLLLSPQVMQGHTVSPHSRRHQSFFTSTSVSSPLVPLGWFKIPLRNLTEHCSTFCPLEDFPSPPVQGYAREGLWWYSCLLLGGTCI